MIEVDDDFTSMEPRSLVGVKRVGTQIEVTMVNGSLAHFASVGSPLVKFNGLRCRCTHCRCTQSQEKVGDDAEDEQESACHHWPPRKMS